MFFEIFCPFVELDLMTVLGGLVNKGSVPPTGPVSTWSLSGTVYRKITRLSKHEIVEKSGDRRKPRKLRL